MKTLSFLISVLLLSTFIGCDNITESKNTATSEEIAAIEEVVNVDELVYEEVGDEDETTYGSDNPNWLGKSGENYGKRARFGRRITNRSGNIEVVLDTDTTATAYIERTYSGKFVSLTGGPTSDSSWSMARFEKPMVHVINRVVHLRKFRDDAAVERRNWKVESVSMAKGSSQPATVSIVKLVVKPEGQDSVVITKPTEYFQNGLNIFTMPRFSKVDVTVFVENLNAATIEHPAGSGITEHVRLHFGRNRRGHHAVTKFEYAGQRDGYQVYKGVWIIQQFKGIHHAVIDVIDNGTILSSEATAYPYSSATWATPYLVTPF